VFVLKNNDLSLRGNCLRKLVLKKTHLCLLSDDCTKIKTVLKILREKGGVVGLMDGGHVLGHFMTSLKRHNFVFTKS